MSPQGPVAPGVTGNQHLVVPHWLIFLFHRPSITVFTMYMPAIQIDKHQKDATFHMPDYITNASMGRNCNSLLILVPDCSSIFKADIKAQEWSAFIPMLFWCFFFTSVTQTSLNPHGSMLPDYITNPVINLRKTHYFYTH